MSEQITAEVKQLDGNNTQDKQARKRRTKEEQIEQLEEQKAILLEKIAKLDAKKQKLSLTPAEKREEKRKAETHCKIVAGVSAFELWQKGQVFFTMNNFKKRLYTELTRPLEIHFLNRMFKETEKK